MVLADALRASLAGALPGGWLYLKDANFSPESDCLFVPDFDDPDSDPHSQAHLLGYPIEGLDNQTLEDVVGSAGNVIPNATDLWLVEAFAYYHRWDAFIPFPGAPDPPSPEVAAAQQKAEFIAMLGKERPDVSCRHPGCTRGAVSLSVHCAEHHYENVTGH